MDNGFSVVKLSVSKFYIFSDENGKDTVKISSSADLQRSQKI